ncbi:MAG: PilZ domain-containing protein [Planctomycetes bacterium]|nr:PilZ domain-containing protein [Planctomycetota bacterium]
MPNKERRRYPRIGRKYGVKVKILGGSMPRDETAQVGMVINLSQGGVVLVSKRPLQEGALVELEFPESVFGGPRTLPGRIVWKRRSEEDEELLGCQFVRVAGEAPAERDEKAGGLRAEPVVRAGRERRRYERWEQKLMLRVRCVTPGPWAEKVFRPALLQDVSKGGVEIVTTREYVRDLVLEVDFPQSALGPKQSFHAKILRSSGSDKPGHFALGCAFVRQVNQEK